MSQKSTTSPLRRYRLHVYDLQVALLRVPPLAFVQEQELMTALVPAPFPPHSSTPSGPLFLRRGRPDQLPPACPVPLCLFRYVLPNLSSHATTST
ncbi:hypothetical protein DPMN_144028 [Dreissena polymorpha]|uniref:Uncharacterized protein n=1 Tax=Dreissena polymorpha TaxID=45954 RepID=A0A9D4GHE8_DREPO|nr:hypothetical protein DPMN_144028 [Dreissena polymorpha]